jgi:phage terminase small subunit
MAKPKSGAPLKNPKHEAFAQSVAKGLSPEIAFKKAGYTPSLKNAHRLKANEGVLSRIEYLQRAAAERTVTTIERTLNELTLIAYSDIRETVIWADSQFIEDEDGDSQVAHSVMLRASDTLSPETARAISKVIQTKDGIRVELHDKLSALDKIGRHLGMFRGRPVTFALPPIETASDISAAMGSVTAAMARGELTPAEAQDIAAVLETHRRAIETTDLEKRVQAIEGRPA